LEYIEKPNSGVEICPKSLTEVLEHVGEIQFRTWNRSEKYDTGVGLCRIRCWDMSEKSAMPVGDRFHQPGHLVSPHPVQKLEFGGSFFCSAA
jgi:hypothetical protein